MKAKPILIVELSRLLTQEMSDKLKGNLKLEIKDYHIIVVQSHSYETNFKVLNGEFPDSSNFSCFEQCVLDKKIDIKM